MSWWDDGAEVLGDLPADKLREAWDAVLADRAELPAFGEAIDAYARALSAPGPQPPFSRIVASNGAEPIGEFDGRAADDELAAAFGPALAAIGEAYQDRFDRPPTPAELVKTMEFVLSYRPEDYLRDAATVDWSRLRLRGD